MSTEQGGIAHFEVRGRPHDVGVQLGRFGAGIAHAHLIGSHAWCTVTAFRADPRVAAMRQLVEQRHPAIWQELQGLAQGLELPLDDVFAWNCRGDVWAMAPDGCTTVLLPGHEPAIAHNEDGDPGLRGHCALVRVEPREGRAFTSFVYPGSIPGHTFAVTETGLVQTVNNIRSRAAGAGLPRMVLGRAVLDCATLDDAIRTIETSPRAGAFHFTMAQSGDSRLFSVEFTHVRSSAVIVQHPLCHANHLTHGEMTGEPQIVTASSAARQARGDDLLRQVGARRPDPLFILRDRQDDSLPIMRQQADDPDDENTLATAHIRVGADRVDWEVHEPADAPRQYRLIDARLVPAADAEHSISTKRFPPSVSEDLPL